MSINHQVIRGIHEKERIALITLFHSLEGNNWYNKIRWCSEEPIDRWHGVKLDPLTHRVNKIILPENRLAGESVSQTVSQTVGTRLLNYTPSVYDH
eukprot:scaffold691_cov181-Ochromonas_danica.AAC.25